MKAILKSIKSKQCANIMNHKQSILVIKDKRTVTAIQKLIDENGYADIYVCCSKINKKHYHLIESIDTDTGKSEYEIDYYIGSDDYLDYCYEGKVAFKFRCYKMEEIYYQTVFEANSLHFLKAESGYGTDTLCAGEFIENTCLTDKELEQYLNTDKPNKKAYAIHISNLEIFDRPKELSEFKIYCDKHELCKCDNCKRLKLSFIDGGFDSEYCDNRLTKAPHNFCYVEVKE